MNENKLKKDVRIPISIYKQFVRYITDKLLELYEVIQDEGKRYEDIYEIAEEVREEIPVKFKELILSSNKNGTASLSKIEYAIEVLSGEVTEFKIEEVEERLTPEEFLLLLKGYVEKELTEIQKEKKKDIHIEEVMELYNPIEESLYKKLRKLGLS